MNLKYAPVISSEQHQIILWIRLLELLEVQSFGLKNLILIISLYKVISISLIIGQDKVQYIGRPMLLNIWSSIGLDDDLDFRIFDFKYD